jgi:hypothetical protein
MEHKHLNQYWTLITKFDNSIEVNWILNLNVIFSLLNMRIGLNDLQILKPNNH